MLSLGGMQAQEYKNQIKGNMLLRLGILNVGYEHAFNQHWTGGLIFSSLRGSLLQVRIYKSIWDMWKPVIILQKPWRNGMWELI